MTFFDNGSSIRESVMFGASKPAFLNDVWTFTGDSDGTPTPTWTKWSGSGTPPAVRCCMGWAFDPYQQEILMYGGAYDAAHPHAYDDTMSWDPTGGWVCLLEGDGGSTCFT
jgi:hypothetical protein